MLLNMFDKILMTQNFIERKIKFTLFSTYFSLSKSHETFSYRRSHEIVIKALLSVFQIPFWYLLIFAAFIYVSFHFLFLFAFLSKSFLNFPRSHLHKNEFVLPRIGIKDKILYKIIESSRIQLKQIKWD